MERHDLIVVGAGPIGLSAAIEAAKRGLDVVVFDENARPGGQLFKQIHKFFGSKEHKAKIRGFNIGYELLEEANKLGVDVRLNATVVGLYDEKEVTVRIGDEIKHFKGDSVLVATGASENMVTFKGWTLPGVIGAGAAQTMMNLHHIKPGNRILMLGSGNVGLVVSYQLMQAGCEVVALVDAAPRIGGYGVHAAKISRCGVPFYLSHTIVEASGTDRVTGVTIAQVDSHFNFIEGTEKTFDVDTICVAVGLSPMSQLLKQAGVKMKDTPGGYVPECDEWGRTSVPGIFAAGDVSGIEEASSAMIEGHIAGAAAAKFTGYMEEEEYEKKTKEFLAALDTLRQGMFAPQNKGKDIKETDEGLPVSCSLLQKGYMDDKEMETYPGYRHGKGVHPVIECSQNIPCNPCQDACKFGCISVGERITDLPVVNLEAGCKNCGKCVADCPGQAIFLVDEENNTVTLPYEFLPLPEVGTKGKALGRDGRTLCDAEIIDVKDLKALDKTPLLTMKVEDGYAMTARFFREEE